MKYKNMKLSKSSIFYIAWIIMVVHICVANSNMHQYNFPIVSKIAMILFALKIMIQKKDKVIEIVLIILICFWGFYASKTAADMRVLWFAIVLCASKGIDFDKFVKYSFITMLLCCVSFVVLHIAGVSKETVIYSVRGIRHSFGFGHPNICSAYYSLLIMQYIYLKFTSIKIRSLGIMLIGGFIVYYFTKSQSGLFTTVATILTVIVVKYLPFKKLNSKAIIIGLIFGIVIFTIIPIFYDNRFFILDKLLTGRLHQANFYYEKYGISLLGNNINEDINSMYTDNILDMGYAKMLINNGLIYYILVVFGYIMSMFMACKEGRRDIIVLLVCFVVYMFVENVATYIFMNVSMLLFSSLLYSQNRIRRKEEIAL